MPRYSLFIMHCIYCTLALHCTSLFNWFILHFTISLNYTALHCSQALLYISLFTCFTQHHISCTVQFVPSKCMNSSRKSQFLSLVWATDIYTLYIVHCTQCKLECRKFTGFTLWRLYTLHIVINTCCKPYTVYPVHYTPCTLYTFYNAHPAHCTPSTLYTL